MDDSDLEDSAKEVDIGPIARAQVRGAPRLAAAHVGGAGPAVQGLLALLPGRRACRAPGRGAAPCPPACPCPCLPPPAPPQVRRAIKSIVHKQQKLQLTAEAQAQRSHSFS